MDRKRLILIATYLLVAGCHESLGLIGDASEDTSTEPGLDPVEDVHEAPADPGPDVACPPAGDGLWLTWTLDSEEWDDAREIDIPCTILWVDHSEVAFTRIELNCGTGGMMEHHVLEIFTNRHPLLEYLTGTSVMLNYVSQPWEWQERWFALRYFGGEIIIAGTTASSLVPRGYTVDEWYYPLSVRFATGLCPQEDNECGLYERAALDVEYWDDSEIVFDGTSTILGGVAAASVTVDTAWYYETITCFDYPDTQLNALFVLLPEG
ncbi:MAG: hypothetical protein JRG91_19105 [Deltaproteobacteria bacterium]|nr:hypothetical protein [Deltaproteobacteria bacterium]